MARWYIKTKKADFNQMAAQYHISPILARLLRNRDIISEEDIQLFLNGTPEQLNNPYLMKDMEVAVNIITEFIRHHERIRVIGDYDIDGICASYILEGGLNTCGAIVDTKLPDRMKDGYGISEGMIRQASEDGVRLIITCDNGIAASGEIALAKKLGMSVIVTDHHEVPYQESASQSERTYILPPADAVIDPHQADCTYPFKGICGAVVAYKLIEALYEKMKCKKSVSDQFLEFAAFATVGDVMELIDENHVIVKYGIEKLKHTRNVGMRALMEVTQINVEKLSAYYIGYILGPCINATGRLDRAERALSLFQCEDSVQAQKMALELRDLNDSRKELTQKYLECAYELIAADPQYAKQKILVVYIPECHESLAGIIAGRLKEQFYKPSFVLTRGEEHVKGSGRSIEAYHMFEEMSKCSDLFIRFGGHRMAAGLSIEENRIEELRSRLNEETTLTDEDMIEKLQIDIPMPTSYATKELVEELGRLEPYGTANPRPLFAQKDLSILSARIMGKNRNAVKITLRNEQNQELQAIWFGDADKFSDDMNRMYGTKGNLLFSGRVEGLKISIAYTIGLNVYMGKESVQLTIQDYC